MRRFAFIILLLSSAVFAKAEVADYFCIGCGKGPLTGQIWIAKWGAICGDCYKLENHCSLCNLPVREGGGTIKTADGRFICKFDKKNAVLDASAAKEIYSEAQRDLVSLFGPGFALQYPDVSVNLFDVDYWSEKGRGDGMHKFGFSSTRKTPSGKCTHQVVMLSGQLRDDIAATAAHEYTHLWINENRAATRIIDGDTVEAICELAAYELMDSRGKREQQKKILGNSYTHGAINKLVEVDRERGFRYVLNWVKQGAVPNFDSPAVARIAPVKIPAVVLTNVPVALPGSLKLGGLLVDGNTKHALISGVSFAAGETKPVKLRDREVRVTCREIQRATVVLLIPGESAPVTLKIGEEKFLP